MENPVFSSEDDYYCLRSFNDHFVFSQNNGIVIDQPFDLFPQFGL